MVIMQKDDDAQHTREEFASELFILLFICGMIVEYKYRIRSV